jgi:fatty-acid desaturase
MFAARGSIRPAARLRAGLGRRGVRTSFFWAGLVRVAVLHHVTWSINSICHMVGDRPWTRRTGSW